MPFESSLPLVAICLATAAICGWYGLQSGSRPAAITAGLAALAGIACFVADRAVVTDRELLEDLFPRLATAAERQELDVLLAAVAPERRPLREEIEEVLRQVKPSDVEVTGIDIALAPDGRSATADLVVRLTGNLVDRGARTAAIAAVLVTLEKRGDRWLVVDAEESGVRAGHP